MQQAGIEAHVYEQAPRLAEVGAGLAVQPNGSRLLRTLGLGEHLQRWGARWVDAQYQHPDGRLIAPMWPAAIGSSIEMYGMHRADLLTMLLGQLDPGVVHTGHQCVAFAQDEASASLRFAHGVEITADVVVGADGIHSALQPYVTPPSPPLASGSVAYRGVVSAEAVGWPTGAMRNWLGPGKHFMAYPVRGGELLNYVGFVPTDVQMRESWSAPGDPARLAAEFVGWNPIIDAILERVDRTFWWGLYDREPLPRWTAGRLTLLGDAAHPMLPHVGQGANQAMEDGVTLATLLASIESVPEALRLYESLRREHTARVQLSARRNGARYDSSGDLSDRDRQLANQAEERAWIWHYDARHAAQEAARHASA
jgi:salicylate hydroxylase